MPHADSALVPEHITSKKEFWNHVHAQLALLLANERNWVTNLANASSQIYNSLMDFPSHFGSDERAVNWCGFYLVSSLFPSPRITAVAPNDKIASSDDSKLLLGPFCGKPACQYINIGPGCSRGVCAAAFLQRQTVLVQDVEKYPGHIACDSATKSEVVCPLILQKGNDQVVLGVMDLDCLAMGGFDETDKVGLEEIADLIVKSCDW